MSESKDVSVQDVTEALKDVIDPELGMNVVDTLSSVLDTMGVAK